MSGRGELDDEDGFVRALAAARQGEAWAAEALFLDVHPRVMRFLRSTEPRAADDIGGEVWLAMARGLDTFEGDRAAFRAWVFGITRRRLADHRRRGARRGTQPVDPHEFFAGRPSDADPAATVADRLEGQAAVDLIVAHLSPEQAELLLLRVVAGLDVAQVAELLGRDANWVRVNQHRALRRLAEKFPRIPADV